MEISQIMSYAANPTWQSPWDILAQYIGSPQLVEIIKNYVSMGQIILVIAGMLAGAVSYTFMSLKVWFCDNEDTKKHLKLSKSKFMHYFLYAFLGLAGINIIWYGVMPPILSWFLSGSTH
jgi:hypothetical protein